jgi:hypothetical protein
MRIEVVGFGIAVLIRPDSDTPWLRYFPVRISFAKGEHVLKSFSASPMGPSLCSTVLSITLYSKWSPMSGDHPALTRILPVGPQSFHSLSRVRK